MKQADLLGVLLKTIGAWELIIGLASLPQAFQVWRPYRDEQELLALAAGVFAAPIIGIAGGLCFFAATNWFVERAGCDRLQVGQASLAIDRRDALGAALKALGYLEIMNGLVRLPLELSRALVGGSANLDGVAYTGVVISTGCFLVFATDWFVRQAYRAPAPHDSEEDMAEGELP